MDVLTKGLDRIEKVVTKYVLDERSTVVFLSEFQIANFFFFLSHRFKKST